MTALATQAREIARRLRGITRLIRSPEKYACELSQIEHDLRNLARQIEEQRC